MPTANGTVARIAARRATSSITEHNAHVENEDANGDIKFMIIFSKKKKKNVQYSVGSENGGGGGFLADFATTYLTGCQEGRAEVLAMGLR